MKYNVGDKVKLTTGINVIIIQINEKRKSYSVSFGNLTFEVFEKQING